MLVDDGHVTAEDRAVGVEYVTEMELVCIATRQGEILTYNVQTLEV